MWRRQWVEYCIVGLHCQVRGCRVVPAGLGKAGGGILLPQDDPVDGHVYLGMRCMQPATLHSMLQV